MTPTDQTKMIEIDLSLAEKLLQWNGFSFPNITFPHVGYFLGVWLLGSLGDAG